MRASTDLNRLVREAAQELADDEPGLACVGAIMLLESRPELIFDLVDRFVREAGKRQPDESLLTAQTYLTAQAAEQLRIAANGGERGAAELIDRLRGKLIEVGKAGGLRPERLMQLVRCLSVAKIDPGPEIREMLGDASERMSGAREASEHTSGTGEAGALAAEAVDQLVTELVAAIGDDVFALQEQIREVLDSLPDEHRAAVACALMEARQPIAREASIGWLCDPSPLVRHAVAARLAEMARSGGMSATMLRRVTALRAWLPEPERPALDGTIDQCSRAGILPDPWPKVRVTERQASALDGTDTQIFIVISSAKQRRSMVTLLGGYAAGVRDASVQRDLRRAELDDILDNLTFGVELFPTKPEFIRLVAQHFLAVGLDCGTVPPFALLDALEAVGLADLQPHFIGLDTILAMLDERLAKTPDAASALDQALQESRTLLNEFHVLDSWFEPEAETAQILPARRPPRARALAMICDGILSQHAGRWAERCAWTALLLADAEDPAWLPLFACARALHAGRPLRDIPLMNRIAEQSIDAFYAAQRQRR